MSNQGFTPDRQVVVAEIAEAKDRIRVTINEWHGKPTKLDLRRFYCQNESWFPTSKGFSTPLTLTAINTLRAALDYAEQYLNSKNPHPVIPVAGDPFKPEPKPAPVTPIIPIQEAPVAPSTPAPVTPRVAPSAVQGRKFKSSSSIIVPPVQTVTVPAHPTMRAKTRPQPPAMAVEDEWWDTDHEG